MTRCHQLDSQLRPSGLPESAKKKLYQSDRGPTPRHPDYEILNKQFGFVFTSDKPSQSLLDKGPSLYGSMEEITVTTNGVYTLLAGIKAHKATGPDEIPGRLLKELASDLAPIFTTLYQASFNQGHVPGDWKIAFVTPIFKKGNSNKAENYHPVSLTSICSKLAVHIIHHSVMRHLENLRIFTNCQHGFRKYRSCETQLILTVDDGSRGLDNSGQIDAILLHFNKASDKVPHRHLLYKLDFYGIRESTKQWQDTKCGSGRPDFSHHSCDLRSAPGHRSGASTVPVVH